MSHFWPTPAQNRKRTAIIAPPTSRTIATPNGIQTRKAEGFGRPDHPKVKKPTRLIKFMHKLNSECKLSEELIMCETKPCVVDLPTSNWVFGKEKRDRDPRSVSSLFQCIIANWPTIFCPSKCFLSFYRGQNNATTRKSSASFFQPQLWWKKYQKVPT